MLYNNFPSFIHSLLHLDHFIAALLAQCGSWTYVILFMIIFAETGLIIVPFLPGDSLLFVLGALSADGSMSLTTIILVLSTAAVLGNMVNYSIGTALSQKVLLRHPLPFVKQAYIDRTHTFFEKYGGKTIIITRFVPIIRSFAPFLAGVGSMPYGKFTTYNMVGGIFWVLVGTLSGYFFGRLEFVRHNFSFVILAIVVISLIPALIEFLRARQRP